MTKKPVGIHRLAGPDHRGPPAWLAGQRMRLRDVLVAGQGVADENGVAAIGIERAVAAVGDGEAGQMAAAIKAQPIRESDGLVLGFIECLGAVHDRAGMR